MAWDKHKVFCQMTGQHFLGIYNHTLDAKGRVSVPSRFRDILKSAYRSLEVVMVKRDGSITIFPYDEWEKFVEETQSLPQTAKKNRSYQRRVFANSTEAEIDKSGRVNIPDTLLKSLGLEKDVVVVGVQNRFEIWSKAAWESFEDEEGEESEDVGRVLKVYEGGAR